MTQFWDFDPVTRIIEEKKTYDLASMQISLYLSSLLYKMSSVLVRRNIVEKCFDIWGIVKLAPANLLSLGTIFLALLDVDLNLYRIIRCRSKLIPLGFSKFVLVLIL